MPFQGIISRLRSIRKPRDHSPEAHKGEDPEHTQAEDPLQEPEASASTNVTGLRRASPSSGRLTSGGDRSRSLDLEPSDYLYFGEGVSATDVSQSLSNRSRSKSTSNTSNPSSGRTPNNPTSHSGKDHSGFLNTQINTHTTQMGYSNLTYGGSLQYDYAGTQGQGTT
ncbi:hypothetical protein F5Y04DRAFT_263707 [Hypomontagnella monticulosa]|nr:hypothetical protein F5Y04DRAFT_263707 [Hypomontagnella monticulosa]